MKHVSDYEKLSAACRHRHSIRTIRTAGWLHPWSLIPFWQDDHWRVAVEPGFVNGYEPVIPMPNPNAGKTQFQSDTPSATDQDDSYWNSFFGGSSGTSTGLFFHEEAGTFELFKNSNGTFRKVYTNQIPTGAIVIEDDGYLLQKSASSDTVKFPKTLDIPITTDPAPYLTVRGFRDATAPAITGVASPGGYPNFFLDYGVRPKPAASLEEITAIATGGTITSSFTADLKKREAASQSGTRRLMAADIVLTAEHAAVNTQVDVHPAGLDGSGEFVVSTPTFSSSPKRFPFRLRSVAKFQPTKYPTALEKYNGDLTEPDRDDLLIGTLWLLSSPDAKDTDLPDESWDPFVQHSTFWNLGYRQANWPPQTTYHPISANFLLALGPIGGSIAFSFGAPIIAAINQENEAVTNFFNNISMRGSFWTAP